MKKRFFKTALPMLLFVFGTLTVGTSCSNSDPIIPPVVLSCSTIGTDFQNIFGTGGSVTYDFDVHSYDFKVSANKSICSIGYQSTAYNVNNPYTIKIYEAGVLVYNQPHVFSATQTSYVPLNLNLTAGLNYTLERIQTNSGPNNDQNIGRVKPVTFPLNSGFMTITASDYYFVSTNGNGTLTNTNLPFIDVVFQ